MDDKYDLCVNKINKNIFIRLSHFGQAVFCDYAICNRIHGNLPFGADVDISRMERLKEGERLFINFLIPNLAECIDRLLEILIRKKIKLIFYIAEEPYPNPHYVMKLLPFAIHMFLQNNIYDHPRIHSLPIGMRDGEEVFPEHRHYTNRYLVNERETDIRKKNLCLLAFSYTHYERRRCEQILGEKDFVMNLNKNEYERQPSVHCGKVPVWTNFKYTHESYYVLSPSGLGEACHRFFEAIYLDAIPIVKRTHTAFDRIYEVFPCMVVEDWDEVTEELLLEKLDEYTDKIVIFKEKYPDIFMNMETVEKLMLLT